MRRNFRTNLLDFLELSFKFLSCVFFSFQLLFKLAYISRGGLSSSSAPSAILWIAVAIVKRINFFVKFLLLGTDIRGCLLFSSNFFLRLFMRLVNVLKCIFQLVNWLIIHLSKGLTDSYSIYLMSYAFFSLIRSFACYACCIWDTTGLWAALEIA